MTQLTYAGLTARGALQDTDLIAVFPAGGPLQRSTNSALLTYLSNTFLRLDGADAMSAPLPLADGVVGTPSLSFGTSPTTGLWSPGAGLMAASAGGIEVLRWAATGMTASKKLTLATTAAALVPLNIPAGAADVSSPAQGDIWNNADTLNYRASGETRGIPLTKSGSFTPTAGLASGGSTSYTTQSGRYIRQGNLVHLEIRLQFTPTTSGASGEFQVAGMPYTAANPNNVAVSLGAVSSFVWSGDFLTGSFRSASTIGILNNFASGAGASAFDKTNLQSGVSHALVMTVRYITSDAF